MTDLALRVEIEVQDFEAWLPPTLPAVATRTRFHARLVERDGVIVLTAKDTAGAVGYALFDKQMSPSTTSRPARTAADVEWRADCGPKCVKRPSMRRSRRRRTPTTASAGWLH